MALVALVADEQNSGESAIAETFFANSERFKEWVSIKRVARVRKCLYLSLLLILASLNCCLFALFKLLTSEQLSLTVATNLVQLTNQLGIF